MRKGFVILGLLVVIALVGLRLFVFRFPTIVGNDMAPTIEGNDTLLANRFALSSVTRGSLVLFEHPVEHRLMIRRVVAIPGDTVEIVKEIPVINGVPLRREFQRIVQVSEDESSSGKTRPMRRYREFLDGKSYEILKDAARRSKDYARTVLNETFFVLSDNRNHGADSRDFGPVPRAHLRAAISHRVIAGSDPSRKHIQRIE